MRKSIITVLSIAVFLLLYCILEMWYFNHLLGDVEQMVDLMQQEQTKEGVEQKYKQLSDYFEKNERIIEIIIPKSELEEIAVALGRIEGFTNEEELFEARVAAKEIPRILSGIHGFSS